ncbi:uncharacterized protein LOC135223856 [Macrobrachium nipponense]|uniref:uncharacterized protein LOC135223856 n=1 Tax=Macrobrachium nipponense TaxID=159736 RepID=UPI0030C7DEAC
MSDNSTNTSDVGDDGKSSEFTWINTHLRIYYLLAIAITGIIGNSISMAVFLGTRLKNHSSYYYLAFMGASDTLFLSFLCVQCLLNSQGLQWLRIEFLSSSAGCKMINYVMSTCTNISVWLTVAYTSERCIAVQYPLLRAQLCTVGRAKLVTAFVTVSNVIANLYVFPTVGRPPGFDNCGYFEEYLQLIRVVSVVDALVMMALPFVLIVCMNSMIVWKLWKLSDVFHGSAGTRHSSSRTFDGTGETPLSPIPAQSAQRYAFPQITLNPPLKLDRNNSPCVWKPSAAIPPNVIEKPLPSQPQPDAAKPECSDKQGKYEANVSKIDEESEGTEPYSNTGERYEEMNLPAEGNEKEDDAPAKDDQVREDIEAVVPFRKAKRSSSVGRGDDLVPSCEPNEEEEGLEQPGLSSEKRDGGKKNDKSEKVFIDVNIRVIIDNGHAVSARGDLRNKNVGEDGDGGILDLVRNEAKRSDRPPAACGSQVTRGQSNAKRGQGAGDEGEDEGGKINVDLSKPRRLATVVELQPRQNKKVAVTSVRHSDASGIKENITKMLLVVSTMFVALQLPSFSLRLDAMWTERTSPLSREVQRILNDLYYSHIFINFLIYSACGSNFRQCLRQMVLSGFLKVTRGRLRQRQRRLLGNAVARL